MAWTNLEEEEEENWQKLSSKSSREDMCRLPTSFLLNIQSRVKQEVDMPQIQKCVIDTFLYTDALCQISGSWLVWFQRKMWQKLSCEQICLCPQYWKSRQTGSGHAADSKLRYRIQFSILMLCAKYQKAGLCGSREKCDRNFLWRRHWRKTPMQDDG